MVTLNHLIVEEGREIQNRLPNYHTSKSEENPHGPQFCKLDVQWEDTCCSGFAERQWKWWCTSHPVGQNASAAKYPLKLHHQLFLIGWMLR
jgi:hypothetical protein